MSAIQVMEEAAPPEAAGMSAPMRNQTSGVEATMREPPAKIVSTQDKIESIPGATSTTPQSASSTPSTGSSSATNQSSNSSNNNKPAGKFKEKRPEPLDLSVKSATSVPSTGGFGNLFNMNMMATLDTPRIIWQDESLMTKHPRLYSSSNSTSNVRMKLSSLAGESPPITPSSPYLDQLMMFASSGSIAGYGFAGGSGSGSPTSLFACRSAGPYNNPVFSSYFNHRATGGPATNQHYQAHQPPHSAKSFFHLGHYQTRREQATPLQALISAQRHFNQWQQMIDQTGVDAAARSGTSPTTATGPGLQTTKAKDKNSLQRQMLASYLKGAAGNERLRRFANPTTGSGNDKAPILSTRRSCSSDDLTIAGSSLHSRLNLQPLVGSDKTKKNSISPLATKNFSSSCSGNKDEVPKSNPTKFLYFCQQQQVISDPSSRQLSPAGPKQLSPVPIMSGEVSQSSSCESNTTTISHRRQAPTPASVVNATENLLNIHLSSPTSSACSNSVTPMFSGASTNEVSPALPPSLGDFLTGSVQRDPNIELSMSASYIQQEQQQHQQQHNHHHHQLVGLRNSIGGSSSSGDQRTPSNLLDKSPFSHISFLQHQQAANQIQQQHLQAAGSLSSSATLNTPTLISPSQFKPGSICFLPSPTLSPMSSVFELPSPLLMFPPGQIQPAVGSPTTNKQNNSASIHSTTTTTTTTTTTATGTSATLAPSGTSTNKNNNNLSNAPDDQVLTVNNNNNMSNYTEKRETTRIGSDIALSSSGATQPTALRQNLSENSLVHLVTSARDKLGPSADLDEEQEFKMDVDTQETFPDVPAYQGFLERPATVVPQILVSEQPIGSCWQSQQQPNPGSSEQSTQHCDQHLQPLGRFQRDQLGKRALSQQSLRSKTSQHHRDRLESCSAPPEVYQRPPSRLKSAVSGGEQQFYGTSQLEVQPRSCSAGQRRYQPIPVASQPAFGYYQHQQQQQQQQQHHQQQTIQYYKPYPVSQEVSQSWFSSGQEQSSWQQGNHHQQQQQQQQQLSAGYNFSQSVQQLNTSSNFNPILAEPLKAGPGPRFGNANTDANNGAPQQRLVLQQNSLSAGELCRRSSPANGNNIGNICSASHQLQTAPSSLSQLDQLIHHSAPMVAANQEQLQPRFLPSPSIQQQQQWQLRAHSADNNGPSSQQHALSGSPGGDLYASARPASACCGASATGSSPATGGAGTPPAKKYHCDQCSKAFTRSDMLTRHKRLHSGDRPFQCNECKQEFSRSDHLSTHMRTHTGEKPYKCKLCSYSACRKDMITRHMKVHNRTGSHQPIAATQMNLRLARR